MAFHGFLAYIAQKWSQKQGVENISMDVCKENSTCGHILVGAPEPLIIHLFLNHLAPLVTHCQDGRQDGETSHIGVLVVQPELVQGYECSWKEKNIRGGIELGVLWGIYWTCGRFVGVVGDLLVFWEIYWNDKENTTCSPNAGTAVD